MREGLPGKQSGLHLLGSIIRYKRDESFRASHERDSLENKGDPPKLAFDHATPVRSRKTNTAHHVGFEYARPIGNVKLKE
jgi:hypothetical protein